MNYYFASGNEQRGPYSLEDLASLALRPDTLVWCEGMPQWQRADSIPELAALIATAEVAPPADSPGAPAPVDTAPQTPPTPLAPQGTLPYGGYAQQPGAPASGLAITSMVLGLVSMCSLCGFHLGALVGLPSAILAIVFGFIAKGKADRNEAGGRGMALAGLILGIVYVGVVVLVVLMILGVAIFAFASK